MFVHMSVVSWTGGDSGEKVYGPPFCNSFKSLLEEEELHPQGTASLLRIFSSPFLHLFLGNFTIRTSSLQPLKKAEPFPYSSALSCIH